jgi:hypothetical protein
MLSGRVKAGDRAYLDVNEEGKVVISTIPPADHDQPEYALTGH